VILTLIVVNCGLLQLSGQNKDSKIGICCCSTKQWALKSKSKDW